MASKEVPQAPLWQVLQPDDRSAEHGENSAADMKVALWLQRHPEYRQLTVVDEAPVDWHKVHAVLATVNVPGSDSIRPTFDCVLDRIGAWIGMPALARV